MTRFREEHYDTKAHKAWAKVQRSGHVDDPFVATARTVAECAERRTLRSEFFKKKTQVRTTKAQGRFNLDG